MGAKNSRSKKSSDAASDDKTSAPPRAAQRHSYDEIDDEKLKENQVKQKKSKQTVKPDETLYADAESSTTDTDKGPKVGLIHPYDEVTTEDLESNRKAIEKNSNGVKSKGKGKSKGSNNAEEATTRPEVSKQKPRTGSSTDPAGEGSEKNLTEEELDLLYAKPQKKTPKASPAPALNYIEVEFTPAPAKPQVKQQRPRSNVNYTNVVSENGKVVLINET